jgi:putative DNA primase/helicase
MSADGHILEQVARRLLGEPNKAFSTATELRWGNRGSLAVNIKHGHYYDHEAGAGGGYVQLVMQQRGVDKDGALKWLREEKFINGADDNIEAVYDYVDEAGKLLFQVCRMLPGAKSRFLQRRPNGHDEWVWNLEDTRRVLYRLPLLLEAVERDMPVLVPEGEKDVNTVVRLGCAATCNPGGAAKRGSKWRPEYSEFLRGADVVLMPDNDEAGWKHVNTIGEALTGVAKRIRVLMMPGCHKDVSDWAAAGGTKEELADMVASAPEWMSPSAVHHDDGDGNGDDVDDVAKAEAVKQEDELLQGLAGMRPGIRRSRERARLARHFRVNPSAIDEELRERWPDGSRAEVAPLYGHWINEPWPETVEGDSLLRDLIRRIRRHVVMPHEDALAVALWIMFAWVHDEVAVHSPILAVTSAEPDSGKSTLIGVMSFLLPRAITTVEISEAALYRSIERWHPSFCIDEFDDVLASADENKRHLRSVINSGHTRNQGVLRCNTEKTGDKTPRQFSTFGPKAIGMIGRKMPGATLSRCIFVEIRRKKAGDPFERFEHKDDPDLAQLRSRLTRWAADNEDVLRDSQPAMPGEAFANRRRDNWRVQLAVADLCGGDWGDQARIAALRLEGMTDKDTIGVKLLSDIRRIFDQDGGDAILSHALVTKLAEDHEAPWIEFSRGKPITERKLAQLLGPYHIISQKISTGGVRGMGYLRVWFEDAWTRYLPPIKAGDSAQDGF